jgi:hypothetical protein
MSERDSGKDYGEPWECRPKDAKYPSQIHCREGKTLMDFYFARTDYVRRSIECANALVGIDDPAAWVREVREVLEFMCGEENQIIHDCGYLAEKWGYAAEFAKAHALLSRLPPQPTEGE